MVVSGDDAMGEILAYSDAGKLDTLNAHPGVKLLLQTYRESFAILQNTTGTIASATRAAMQQPKSVAPLLKTKWNQDAPYNLKTGYNYTGCVATAIAQLMNYHQWPAQGKGSNRYYVTYYNVEKSADFSQSHYDWNNMLPRYDTYPYPTEEEKNAVAQLMSDVGIAVNMQYQPYQSGAQNQSAYKALQENFDYSAALVTKSDEGSARFTEILRKELLNGFPLYISGDPKNGSGHAWVVDGFDSNGLFHMNFGWGGQADGYFSLNALNIDQTGSEFGGKPLTFRYRLLVILAHPNKTGVEPIDEEVRAGAPNIEFTIEGEFVPVFEGSESARTDDMEVKMRYFHNQGNSTFTGDIGVAIYDAKGNRLAVYPSPDHATGGFTRRYFGLYNDGKMPSGGLIDQFETLKVSLKDLPAGYYRLVPVCATLADDGSWGSWVRMKKAPTIELELSADRIRVAEVGTTAPSFQLAEQPEMAEQNNSEGETQVQLAVKNLYGLGMDGFMKLSLLDDDGSVVATACGKHAANFEGFALTRVKLALKLDAVQPKTYRVQIELIKDMGQGDPDDASAPRYTVRNIHNKEQAMLTVQPQLVTYKLGSEQTAFYDNSNDKITDVEIDLRKNNLISLRTRVKNLSPRACQGSIHFYLQDMQSQRMIAVGKELPDQNLLPGASVEMNTGWLKSQDLRVVDGRGYRIVVRGNFGGNEFEIKSTDMPGHYVMFKGSIYDETTAIGEFPTAGSIEVRSVDGMVEVHGTGLRRVRIFDTSGRLLGQAAANGSNMIRIPLRTSPHGVCLLHITGNGYNVSKVVGF